MTVEHSPVGRRGFFASFVMVGYAVGCSLATIVFLPVFAEAKEGSAVRKLPLNDVF